jgi:hypothetical protein
MNIKKILIVMMMLTFFTKQTVAASHYQTFQDITFEHQGMTLLEDYTNADYERLYDKLPKWKFWGWDSITAYDSEKAYFVKETLYVVSNNGYSDMDETITFTQEFSDSIQMSVSQGIDLSGSGDVQEFDVGLKQSIDMKFVYDAAREVSQKYTLDVTIDPQTVFKIQILGEGKVTSGVAKYHAFFRTVKKGGWEVFVVTTEYYSFSKEPI